jgi:hypothetical protein
MRDVMRAARSAGQGLSASEDLNTRTTAEIPGSNELQTLVMWPKLFRRLAEYFASGNIGLSGFDAWIRENVIMRDDRLLLPDGEFGNIHDVYVVEDDIHIQLRVEPEEVVILPDNA